MTSTLSIPNTSECLPPRTTYRFLEEPFDTVIDDLKDIFIDCFNEVGPFKTEFNPDLLRYKNISDQGMLKIYTIRNKSNTVIAVAVFAIYTHSYARHVTQAVQDVIYVKPEHRGILSAKFILWIDQQLHNAGANVVLYSVKPEYDFSRLLVKIGCRLTNLMYVKTNE